MILSAIFYVVLGRRNCHSVEGSKIVSVQSAMAPASKSECRARRSATHPFVAIVLIEGKVVVVKVPGRQRSVPWGRMEWGEGSWESL